MSKEFGKIHEDYSKPRDEAQDEQKKRLVFENSMEKLTTQLMKLYQKRRMLIFKEEHSKKGIQEKQWQELHAKIKEIELELEKHGGEINTIADKEAFALTEHLRQREILEQIDPNKEFEN